MKYFFLFLITFIATERFCHKQTQGFTLHKIAREHSSIAQEVENPEIAKILDQPYTFLGHGGQSYVFLSKDENYVIKFFKQHHINYWNLLNRLPFKSQKFLKKREHQSPQFFESCRIAYKNFKDRTGLVYLHLNKTQIFHKKLTLIDNLKIAHKIDLDTTDFALQRRATPAHQKFKELLAIGNLDDAKKCIDSLLNLINERKNRGIIDRDPSIRKNIGFIGTEAIEMDLGSYSLEPIAKLQDSGKHILKFRKWLESKNKELALYFDDL